MTSDPFIRERTEPAAPAQDRSPWLATADMPVCLPLGQDLRADVCIVGAGAAGLSTAYLLARAGKSVVVLDDGPLASGTTAATTAHLTCFLDERYYDLERLHGEDGARLAAESHSTAINRIETIVAREQIDCDFDRLNGYLFTAPGDDDEVLRRELAAAQRAGIDASIVDRAPHPTLATGPCLLFPNQAQFHPLKYVAGLARAIQRDGGRLFTMTHVSAIEGGSPARIHAGDHVVTADAVVIATHSPVNDLVAIHTDQVAWMTYVIGARVPPGSVMRALYWDTGRPYHYARLQAMPPDGASGVPGDGELLIVGGEDHRTGQADDTTMRHARLEKWARERFPSMERVEFTWAGRIMQTFDGLAFIGRNPLDRDNVYVVTGDSGTGMTHSMIAAILLCDLIDGGGNPWQDLYDPARKPRGAVRAFGKGINGPANADLPPRDRNP